MANPNAFEFFMIFYGLLLGLAVTELFGGFGNLLRERNVPAFGILTPLIGAVTLTEIVANFIDAWDSLHDVTISLGDIGRPTLIGITYFALAAIIVPRDRKEWASLDNYFMKRRSRFAILLIFGNILVAIPEVPLVARMITDRDHVSLIFYFLGNIILFGSYILLLLGRSRASAIIPMIAVLIYYAIYYFEDITGLHTLSSA